MYLAVGSSQTPQRGPAVCTGKRTTPPSQTCSSALHLSRFGPSSSLSPPPLNPDLITHCPQTCPLTKCRQLTRATWVECPFLQLPLPPSPQESLATTETFKQQKVRMAKEGFDPSTLSDPLYILDPAAGAYLPLTPARYGALLAGDLRI